MNRRLRVSLLAAAAGIFALANHFDFPLCPVASSFGIPCPGCGLTRATLALLRGHVHEAATLHPLVFLLSPLSMVAGGLVVFEFLLGASRPRTPPLSRAVHRLMTLSAAALLVLTLGVWLARFAGHFGGPVPVTSLRQWLAAPRELTR